MPSPLSERERDACIDILDNARAARGFIDGLSLAAFTADQRTNYAVVRCIEIISEASRRVDEATKARHPHIPWRQIAKPATSIGTTTRPSCTRPSCRLRYGSPSRSALPNS